MGTCLILRRKGSFKAWISVQANPGATITAASTKKTYTAVADSTTGIATILVKKKGDYAITTDCGASYDAIGNISLVSALKNKQTYKAQKVKLNAGYSSFEVRSDYESNSLLAYWDGTKPDAYCTNYYVEEVTSGGYVGKYVGVGESYDVDTTTTVTGYKETVDGGTEKEYRLTSYLCINGIDYYGAPMTASGTAVTYEAYTENVTATKTLTVPAACKSITAFIVGGGGGSADAGYVAQTSGSYKYIYTSGTAGGGGGYTTTKTFSCIPGQTFSMVIGSGGSTGKTSVSDGTSGKQGNSSSITIGDLSATAKGGYGGTMATSLNLPGSSYDLFAASGGSGTGKGGNAYYGKYCGKCESGGDGIQYNGTYYGGGGMSGGGVYVYTKSSASRKLETYTSGETIPTGGLGGGGRGEYMLKASNLSTATTYIVNTAGTANTGGGGGGGQYNEAAYGVGNGGSGVIIITYNF